MAAMRRAVYLFAVLVALAGPALSQPVGRYNFTYGGEGQRVFRVFSFDDLKKVLADYPSSLTGNPPGVTPRKDGKIDTIGIYNDLVFTEPLGIYGVWYFISYVRTGVDIKYVTWDLSATAQQDAGVIYAPVRESNYTRESKFYRINFDGKSVIRKNPCVEIRGGRAKFAGSKFQNCINLSPTRPGGALAILSNTNNPSKFTKAQLVEGCIVENNFAIIGGAFAAVGNGVQFVTCYTKFRNNDKYTSIRNPTDPTIVAGDSTVEGCSHKPTDQSDKVDIKERTVKINGTDFVNIAGNTIKIENKPPNQCTVPDCGYARGNPVKA